MQHWSTHSAPVGAQLLNLVRLYSVAEFVEQYSVAEFASAIYRSVLEYSCTVLLPFLLS